MNAHPRALATASSFSTLLHCRHSLTLQRDDIGKDWSVRLGNAVHEMISDSIRGRKSDASDRYSLTSRQKEIATSSLATFNRWMAAKSFPISATLASEVSFAFDWKARRCVAVSMLEHRDYSFGEPHWLYGTADLVVIMPDRLEVYDWKTGWTHVKSAADGNWQMIGLAAMAGAAKLVDFQTITSGVVRIREDGYHEESSDLDTFDVAVAEGRLVSLGRSIEAGDFAPKTGDWCDRCPARKVCIMAPKKEKE